MSYLAEKKGEEVCPAPKSSRGEVIGQAPECDAKTIELLKTIQSLTAELVVKTARVEKLEMALRAISLHKINTPAGLMFSIAAITAHNALVNPQPVKE